MKDGFNVENFKELYKYEDSSFWFKARNRLIIYMLKKYFSNVNSFMEIGCGTGYVLKKIAEDFPKSQIYGSELFEEGLKFAKKRIPRAKLIQLNAVDYNEKDIYDVIGAFDVLEHINEDEKVLNNMYNAVKKGIIITVPQHKFLWSDTDIEACHVRRYTKKELIVKLQEAGFKIKIISSFVSLLFPFMVFSRYCVKSKETQTELKLPKILNDIFYIIMLIEIFMIKLGVRFPCGGSLIVVAEKKLSH